MKVFRCSIFKQLAGAVIGALVAFGVYSAYKEFSPQLGAYINIFQPQSEEPGSFAQQDLDVENKQYERRMQRNQEVLEQRAAPQQEVPFQRIADKAKEFEQNLTAEQEQEILEGMDEFVPEPEPQPDLQADVVPDVLPADQGLENIQRVPFEGGDELPNSGIGFMLAAAGALTVATALRKRKKKA